jgi:hypothetical protein
VTGQVLAATTLLADTDKGKGSPIGLFVVLVLVIAVYFLYRSMNKHIKRVPVSFGPDPKLAPSEPMPSETDVAPTDGAEASTEDAHDAADRAEPKPVETSD